MAKNKFNLVPESALGSKASEIIEDDKLKNFAIESSINAIAFGDLEGKVIYVNEACVRMWGGEDRSELLGRRFDFFFQPSENPFEIFYKVFSKGYWEGEVAGVRKDGSLATVYLSAFLVKDEKDQPLCMMCSLMDISEKKQIEEEMKLKDFAIESSINAIALGDLEGNITYVNRAFIELWEGDESEILGESVYNLVPPENEVEKIISRVLNKGSWFGEITAQNKQDKWLTLQVSASLVLDKEQNPLRLITSFVDISEKKQIEEEMKLKDFAIESSINAIALGDLEGNITYVNRAFIELWEGDESEILGESVYNLVPPENEVEKIIARIINEGSWFGELTARNKQGKWLTLQVSASLVLDKEQNPLRLITSFVDISERKRAEEELSNAKEQLEAKVAERTESLVQANEQLKKEIEERKNKEEQLREKEQELEQKAENLEEVNTALQVLIKQREQDKLELEEKVVTNVKELIMPYIKELRNAGLDSKHEGFLNIVASNLENIVSPFAKNLTSNYLDLTPTQLQIAELIKSGRSTKDIAEIMEITDRAVEFHRNNIRDKLGLKHKKINLQTYLLSLSY